MLALIILRLQRLEQLSAELADIFAGRHELGAAFPMMVDCWRDAAIRDLTR
jgi:hypothetical protein